MEAKNAASGAAGVRFFIACNRSENEEHWDSADAEQWARQRHRFMLVHDF